MGKANLSPTYSDSDQASTISTLVSSLSAAYTTLNPFLTNTASGNLYMATRVGSLSGAAGI